MPMRILLLLLLLVFVFGHGGAVDKQDGHFNRKDNNYHCNYHCQKTVFFYLQAIRTSYSC